MDVGIFQLPKGFSRKPDWISYSFVLGRLLGAFPWTAWGTPPSPHVPWAPRPWQAPLLFPAYIAPLSICALTAIAVLGKHIAAGSQNVPQSTRHLLLQQESPNPPPQGDKQSHRDLQGSLPSPTSPSAQGCRAVQGFGLREQIRPSLITTGP